MAVFIIVCSCTTLLHSLPAGVYTGFADYLTTVSRSGEGSLQRHFQSAAVMKDRLQSS